MYIYVYKVSIIGKVVFNKGDVICLNIGYGIMV